MNGLCERLAADLGQMFACSQEQYGVRVRTPFLYPDGDAIDVFLRETPSGERSVSDLGETVRWLRMNTTSNRRSPKQTAMILDTAVTHGVQFYKGMLRARVSSEADTSAAILRVAQAALRASDVWFTFRTSAMQSSVEDVADWMNETGIRFDRRPAIPGRSGRVWNPDFHTLMPQRTSLVYVLSTGNRAFAKSLCNHVVAAWHDLSHLATGREPEHFVSLFDDTLDVWQEEDYKLVASLSQVARWSDPQGLQQILEAA